MRCFRPCNLSVNLGNNSKQTWVIIRFMDSSNSVAVYCQILKLVHDCRKYRPSKPKQGRFRYTAWLKRPNFWGSFSPDSAGTLIRRGGTTNNHSLEYSLSNISAKNSRKSFNVCWSYSVLHQCHFFQTQCSSWSTTMLLCVYVWYLGWWYESWHHQQISGVYWY